jgi:hypothetical protein
MFRILGQTIRLGPGETRELAGPHHASAPELRALCAKGAVRLTSSEQLESVGKPPAAEADTPAEQHLPDKRRATAEGRTGETRSRGRSHPG